MILDFNSKKAKERCKHCGNLKEDHNGKTKACPIGQKHRTVGFTQFSEKAVFEIKG
jgi:hypothetical protein